MYASEVRAKLRHARVLVVRMLAHVARIKRDAGVVERWLLQYLTRDRHRLGWRLHAHAMHAEVDLHVHVDLALRDLRRRRELSESGGRIERDGQLHLVRDVHDASELRRADERIREQQVVRHVAHDFELARRRAREPDRAKSKLVGGDAG